MWSEEHLDRHGRRGLYLEGDRATLRDPVGYRFYRGLVWQDEPDVRGSGTPLWAQVHTARAATAMEQALCQVCGHPAARTDGTIPWILPARREPRRDDVIVTEDPPTCDGCLDEALASCPALHQPFVLDVHAHDLVGWVAAVRSPDGGTATRWVFRRDDAARGVIKRRLAGLTRWTERTP
ncbi:hypothetical protein DVS28_b0347 (plasmid) [Euzebya pacifica]|uniref:Uncharacterized protein n=1 Tax=Euzebya pacifica TaxID=1608957 RepID=A0A346Y6M0_9ACTN|nr:hypothetical protein [Euzebya pacifica]AXV10117.1 hypothetical protein DVS28_b0347 [Euzebya pacifica]